MHLISIVIPAYNEEETIRRVIDNIISLPLETEIIVVNDGSTDNTGEIISKAAEKGEIKAVNHPNNQGKTAALKSAFEMVTGDITVIQDADLEYDTGEITHLINPILEGRADVVYGSRFMVREAARVLYFYHYLANKLLTFINNILTNKNMTDIETCYKAFRSPLIARMPISSKGFGFEVEVTAKICKTKARIYEIPISYYGRTYEEGKKIMAWDGMAAFWYLIKYNLLPSRKTSAYVNQANSFLNQYL